MLNGGVGDGPVIASHELRFKWIAHGVKIGSSEKAKGSAALYQCIGQRRKKSGW